MKTCFRCGAIIKNGAKFCANCGAKIENVVVSDMENSMQQPSINRSSSKRIFVVTIALILVVAIALVGVFIYKKGNPSFSENSEPTQETVAPAESKPASSEHSTDSVKAESKQESLEEDVITGVHSYTGTIKADGSTCCLELEKAISFKDSLNTEPITSNCLWIDESDAKMFKGYNGLTVTLKGELFNYRGGGSLMFNGTPIIENVSGTPNIVEQSSSYENWDKADNETKFWDAAKVLEDIIYECEGVWDVRVLCDSSILNQVKIEGFEYPVSVSLAINDTWVSSQGYEISIMPERDCIYIAFGSQNGPSVPLYTYNWKGEFVQGEMPLDRCLVQEGLI